MKKYLLSLLMITSLAPIHSFDFHVDDRALPFFLGYLSKDSPLLAFYIWYKMDAANTHFQNQRNRVFLTGISAGCIIIGIAAGIKKLIDKNKEKANQKELIKK
jgi:hypothetical protein